MNFSERERSFFRELAAAHRAPLAIAVALMVAQSVVTLTVPWFGARTAAALLESRIPGPLLLAWLAVLALQAALAWAGTVVLGGANARIGAAVGTRLYDHLQSLPLAWHHSRRRGEVLALLASDVWRVSEFLTETVVAVAPLVLTCMGALALLVWIEPLVGFAIALGVPLFVVVLRLGSRGLRALSRDFVEADAVRQGIAEQNLAAVALIKAFTQERAESLRYASQTEAVRDLGLRQLRIAAALTPILRWLTAAAVLTLLWFGSQSIASGRLTTPELVAMLMYGMLLAGPVGELAGVYGQLQAARGAVQRILDVMDETPEPDSGPLALGRARGDLAFEAVTFAYPGRARVLEHMDLHVRAGETVAITGENGAGKSTIVHLLMRFADPEAGRIVLDGHDLRGITLASLRAQIGLVSQHVLLLNDTVAHNIGYGRAGATREDMVAAARSARAHEFIERLPQGYETVIGDDGVRLSGGQKQRLALARALLKDPAVLVLDEATAMFDPEGERELIAQCRELLRARTVLLITHRPASLALADRVLRLENGRLREISTTESRVAVVP